MTQTIEQYLEKLIEKHTAPTRIYNEPWRKKEAVPHAVAEVEGIIEALEDVREYAISVGRMMDIIAKLDIEINFYKQALEKLKS